MRSINTFSIVARDETNGDLGVAVASKFLAVGSVVPWVRAGVGAVATQSYANTSFGTGALERLQSGTDLESIAAVFAQNDKEYQMRQYGMVAADGSSFTFTGSSCHAWAGGRTGQNFAAQGNLLTGPEVVDALADVFLTSSLPLPERLLAALLAADRAGGDARGRQSAALYIARERGGYAELNDRYIDLRVDEHPDPVPELQRLLSIHRLLFERPNENALLELKDEIATRMLEVLKRAGRFEGSTWSDAAQAKLEDLAGMENLEERFPKPGFIDPVALNYLEQKYGIPSQSMAQSS
jgi:uncharacterized Ntn-hydrolase superfamily protein